MVRSTLGFLHSLDLIQEAPDGGSPGAPRLALTERGNQALLEVALRRSVTESVKCVFDCITGDVHPRRPRARFRTIDPRNADGLRPIPTAAQIDDANGLSKSQVAAALEEQKRQQDGVEWDGSVLEVLKTTQRALRFRTVDIAVFRRGDDQFVFRVLDRGVRLRSHEEVLHALQAQDLGVLPVEIAPSAGVTAIAGGLLTNEEAKSARENAEAMETLNENINALEEALADSTPDTGAVEEQLTTREQLVAASEKLVAMQAERDQLQQKIDTGFRSIHTEEIREYLLKALKHARKQVIVISPWLSFDVVDREFKNLVAQALARGVEVVIGWGYPEEQNKVGTKKNEKSQAVVDELRKYADKTVRERGGDGKVRIVKLGNTHQKVLVADRKFAVIGSFNYLSYRGSKRVGEAVIRKETGYLVQVESKVEEIAARELAEVELAESALSQASSSIETVASLPPAKKPMSRRR